MPRPATVSTGRVTLVGAGPGDPGLITLRAVERLRAADVVLYDYLVNPRVLDHARPDAELVCLGRHGQGRLMPPGEVHERMIAAARAGRAVVRLKSGDPLIFARAADEIDALLAAGVPLEIVPGVTAALASGSYAGITLTDRDHASAVALVTGRESDDKDGAALDYRRLAAFPGTLVIYMGVTAAPHWSAELIRGGRAADEPAAIVRRCSWPDQSIVRCTLADVPGEMARRRLRPPVIVIVGDVVAARPVTSWFTDRPLFGRRILVTRAAEQADELRDQLEALGAETLAQPAIEISDPPDWAPVDAAIARLDRFDWLVFSSSNGVRRFLDRLLASGGDARRLARARLAAIGPGTAAALGEYALRADVMPDEHRAEALAAALASDAAGRRFLLLRASRGRDVLAESLRAAGAEVEQAIVYTSRDVATPDAHVAERLAAGEIHWATVTSSAIARSLVALFGDTLANTRLASISPLTSSVLRELGHEPAAEATDYTMAGLVEAIVGGNE